MLRLKFKSVIYIQISTVSWHVTLWLTVVVSIGIYVDLFWNPPEKYKEWPLPHLCPKFYDALRLFKFISPANCCSTNNQEAISQYYNGLLVKWSSHKSTVIFISLLFYFGGKLNPRIVLVALILGIFADLLLLVPVKSKYVGPCHPLALTRATECICGSVFCHPPPPPKRK